ncbi:MAG: CHASE2 domain-containing protein [Alphaproteobacteria bacterium]|nr:CHASE2 domain-containing protein [Alphaproteobacteria bacterium]
MARYLFRGWGRQAAWAVLVLFVGLQVLAPAAFERPRLALFDLYQTSQPRLEHESPVVIVAIDEATLKSVGQWPWPRQVLARLVTKILDGRPAALALDMIMPESDRTSPEQWLRDAGDMPGVLNAAIRALPKHDDVLARALSSGPVMIGVGGMRRAEAQADNGLLAPFRLVDPAGATASPPTLPSFNGTLRSVAVLDKAARGHGLLSVDADADGTFRRLPMVSVVASRLAPSMGLELLRLTAKAPWITLYSEADRITGVGVGPLSIPTQADGSTWVHFSPHDPKRYLPAADVLAGKVDPTAFEQRIVLVGVTGLGLTDWRPTPVGVMPGTEITAQLLENVLDGRLVRRPGWTLLVEPALTFAFGMLLIVVLRLVRVPWQLLIVTGAIAALLALGFWIWRSLTLIDVATPALGQALVFFAFLAGNSAQDQKQKRQLRRELEERKVALAKAEGEMEAGRRIQMGMLPGVASVAGDKRFDLGALMVPARQIGGDLYDFFKIDARRLFFAVGDVSGKGVPAALFMALGKSLCRSYALRGTNDVGTIIRLANGEIARDNPEMLFITMFAGVLDLDTGEVEFCNAGHDAPFVLRPGGAPEAVVAEGGPPLCVVEDFGYKTEHLRLKPGQTLCVTTDGVAEAMDASGALLGSARTKEILAAIPRDANATEVVDELYKAVGRFVGAAEASDDLTVLAIRWNGP